MKFLFHGADKATLELICREGFDSRVANLNGLLGAGNYFAYAASYSHDYSKSVRSCPSVTVLHSRFAYAVNWLHVIAALQGVSWKALPMAQQ